MNTGIAYLTVVIVWATTPLAIKWSSLALPPVMSAMVRMMIAVLVGLPILWALGMRLRWEKPALKAYAAASPGVFGAMALSYVGSQYVPSGMVSLMFGLAPLLSGLMMQFTPTPTRLNLWHWAGCLAGLAGLGLVFADALQPGAASGHMVLGLVLLLAAVTGFSVSGILVKEVNSGLHPLAHTMGALVFSLPLYGLLSWGLGEHAELGADPRGLGAILYLALFGSLLGFVSYYLVLSRLPAATVALITLITPVLALMLGSWLNGEQVSDGVMAGAGVILGALALYFLGDRRVRRLAPAGS